MIKRFCKHLPTLLNWGCWSLLFILFSWWHGSFEPSLTEHEIDEFAQKLHRSKPELNIEEYKELLAKDSGDPIYMVNMIKYHDEPVLTEGQSGALKPQELVQKYNYFVGKFLIQRGSYPIFLGDAIGGTAAAWGVEEEDKAGWSEAVIVRYRNIRTMMQLATNEQFNENLDLKHAALEKTIIYPTGAKIMVGRLDTLVFFVLLCGALATQLIMNNYNTNTSR